MSQAANGGTNATPSFKRVPLPAGADSARSVRFGIHVAPLRQSLVLLRVKVIRVVRSKFDRLFTIISFVGLFVLSGLLELLVLSDS